MRYVNGAPFAIMLMPRNIEEKLTKLAEIFKIEDAEAEDNNKLRIHVLPHDRPLLHALLPIFCLNSMKQP